jgi:hypothetical protein
VLLMYVMLVRAIARHGGRRSTALRNTVSAASPHSCGAWIIGVQPPPHSL